eukprot:532699-Alexandrium_andersonii.AAC.1
MRPEAHRRSSPVGQGHGLLLGPPGPDRGLGARAERPGPRGCRPQADAGRQGARPDGPSA